MIEVVNVNPEAKDRHICILGVVNNEAGLRIESEMIEWLTKYYRVIEVRHDGTQFEFPAMRFMQLFSSLYNVPCLYLHTRGAFHRWNTTKPTHRMWEHEFGDLCETYFRIIDTDEPAAACPFTGEGKETFYNGFVANAAAFRSIPAIRRSEDRMIYEFIFRDSPVKVYATKFGDCSYGHGMAKARNYLLTNHK